MNKVVSFGEAKRRFLEFLRMVRDGQSVTVTAISKPVARIIPVNAKEGARSALLARLRKQRVTDVGRWTRDELYDAP